MADDQTAAIRRREQIADLVAWIDEDRLARLLASQDEAVLPERLDGARLDYHGRVILAIVDDLMAASKIRAAAARVGALVVFARSREGALAEMRAARPSLVVVDLDSPRTDPIGTIEAVRRDPSLADVPAVGFVSHVRTEVIAAARQAGISEVLARSAFADKLPDILARAGR